MNILKWFIWYCAVMIVITLSLWLVSEDSSNAWLCVIYPYLIVFTAWVTANTHFGTRKPKED